MKTFTDIFAFFLSSSLGIAVGITIMFLAVCAMCFLCVIAVNVVGTIVPTPIP